VAAVAARGACELAEALALSASAVLLPWLPLLRAVAIAPRAQARTRTHAARAHAAILLGGPVGPDDVTAARVVAGAQSAGTLLLAAYAAAHVATSDAVAAGWVADWVTLLAPAALKAVPGAGGSTTAMVVEALGVLVRRRPVVSDPVCDALVTQLQLLLTSTADPAVRPQTERVRGRARGTDKFVPWATSCTQTVRTPAQREGGKRGHSRRIYVGRGPHYAYSLKHCAGCSCERRWYAPWARWRRGWRVSA
jgi:hypothetical protein